MNDQRQFGDRYRLLWQEVGMGQVGEVRNYATDGKGYRRIRVILDDELIKRIGMRFLAATWDNGQPVIIVSRAFMGLAQKMREAGIWHEVGHIHHKHHLRNDFCDQAQLRKARRMAVERGHVLPMEEEADRFAVVRAGKETVTGFLQFVLSDRPNGGQSGWNAIGRRELEIRIAAIQLL